MTISTKYSPGDEVWFMDFTGTRCDLPKEPCRATVEEVKIQTNGNVEDICYWASGWRSESELFPSKAALLESL